MADQLLDAGVETPAGDVPVIPVFLMLTGAYLVWFGVRYWGSDTRWPTDPVKSLLTGQGLPTPDTSARQAGYTSVSAAKANDVARNVGSGAAAAAGAALSSNTLTKDQLKALWTANGGNPATANLAAAHALAESSGRTWITSPNPDGGTNVGLWQLDTPKGEGAGYTVDQLKDPNLNAKITVMKTANGTNWSHWSADPTPYL